MGIGIADANKGERAAIMPTSRAIGQSTNLVGLPTPLLGSAEFNAHPLPMHISGCREMNPNLWEMLSQAEGLAEAGEAFHAYMLAMFGLDPEQRERRKEGQTGPRRFRSSFLRLLKGWGYDSNGPEGAVLKGWVESRFGLFPTYHKEAITRLGGPVWLRYIEEKMSSRFHNNAIHTQLDMMYEFCQWALAAFSAPGRRHLTLYRGTNSFDEHQIIARLEGREVLVRLNNLASFSEDRDVAGCFGDVILTARVPTAKIVFFNTLLPVHPLKGEGEYLVIGGEYRATASYF